MSGRDLEVLPLKPPGAGGACLLALFHDAASPAAGRGSQPPAPPADAGESELEPAREIAHLRQELTATKEYLQSLVEQQDGIVPAILRKMSVEPKGLADQLRAELAKQPSAYGGSQPTLSPRLRKVTDAAQAEDGPGNTAAKR